MSPFMQILIMIWIFMITNSINQISLEKSKDFKREVRQIVDEYLKEMTLQEKK